MTTEYEPLTVVTVCLRSAPPVSIQPEVRLEQWAIHEVKDEFFLIGWNVDRDGPRYSTPIRHFDRQARTVVTRSGRRYFLIGEPGPHPLALLAWQVSCQVRGESSVDVTRQLLDPQ